MSAASGQFPGILNSTGQMDRQDPTFIDIDLTIARATPQLIQLPFTSTVLVGDPLAYDGETTASGTLYTGYVYVRPEKTSAAPVRLEAGGNFKMPPTNKIYIQNPAQSSRMIRVYALPLAYDLKFYLRFDTPAVAAATFGQVTITSTATLIAASQPGRHSLMMQNNNAAGSDEMYIGPSASVTTATGLRVSAQQTFWFDQDTAAWYGICQAAKTADCRFIIEG